ncbi:MAG: class I SAM-dependent methyltransferase [Parachlamydiales bacterium]|nr:class I SAM-dependent methyltransferase [Parachlamydiales bacterium]
MLKSLLIFFAIVCLTAQEHTESGTQFGQEGAKAYAQNRHGPDGALFLDPYFIPYLLNLENLTVLDAGCGAGPWAIFAAQNGASVFAIDIQQKMIDLAIAAAKDAKIEERITFLIGDVANLPYSSQSFDLALSINVGCNLPSNAEFEGKSVGLGPHVAEMGRTLKPNGKAILTAPASFGTVFGNGSSYILHIEQILSSLPENPSPSEIVSHLNQLKEVYRATFAIRNRRLVLITDESKLIPGEEIWRKLPGLTVPNRYHGEAEYLQAFNDAGLVVERIARPRFNSEEEWSLTSLGKEYLDHHPFVIFYLKAPD